jgi:hypothetical protein
MGIDRWRALALAAVTVAAAGCTNINKCRSETLLLTITLDAGAAVADQLQLQITVGGSTTPTTITHAAGSASGTVEVRFPSGYPTGQTADVAVTALQGGSPVGAGATSVSLSNGCAVGNVSVAGGAVIEDLSMSVAADLSGADLSMLAMQDLAMQDLSTPPGADLSCPSQTENCFNGVDDNCDGLVDCADPQCTGGSSPVAECVPDPGATPAGTLAGVACPTAYPTASPLNAGLMAGTCAGGSCACGNQFVTPPVCKGTVDTQGGNQLSCNNIGTNIWNHTSADGCVAIGPLNSSTYYWVSAQPLSGMCNPPTGGTPTKNPPTWTTTNNLCSGNAVGGGCTAGKICVPAAPNHCVVQTGDQVACNVPGYTVQNTTHFYSGFDDSGRTCACACNVSGSCSTVIAMGTSTCNIAVSSACQNSLGYAVAKVNPPSSPACLPGATSGGSATSTAGFERTVCCTN